MSTEVAQPQVLTSVEGALTRITLNRPRALNALNHDMVKAVYEAIQGAAQAGSNAVLLDSSDERGFCGGGDVKAMREGGIDYTMAFLHDEYRADYAVHTSRVPVVAIMHGITMGGGIGLAGHAAIRVVTETSRLAMPETRIGIVPDVGGHLPLAKAPGRLGELLAITSGSMTAGDAIALGFADFYVPYERLDALRERLVSGEDPSAAVAALAEPAPPSELVAAREWFDPIADAALGEPTETLADAALAAQRLVEALETSAVAEAQTTAATVREMCPTSVAVTIGEIARVRREGLGLAEVLVDDYRLLGRLCARSDFIEGVRALLIDRDNNPQWLPASLEQLEPAVVAAILDPAFADGENALELA